MNIMNNKYQSAVGGKNTTTTKKKTGKQRVSRRRESTDAKRWFKMKTQN